MTVKEKNHLPLYLYQQLFIPINCCRVARQQYYRYDVRTMSNRLRIMFIFLKTFNNLVL